MYYKQITNRRMLLTLLGGIKARTLNLIIISLLA
jgi:hypothetical protein